MEARDVVGNFQHSKLTLISTLQELPLWQLTIEIDNPGDKLAELFKQEPLLPGVILTESQVYVGMISRQKFFEHMSRPYSLGLFSGREIKQLYQFLQPEVFILDGNTSIVKATPIVLGRASKLVYEPIVVETSGKYGVLDCQQLLLADSRIHILTLARLEKKEEQFKIAEANLSQIQQNYLNLIQTEKKAVLEELIGGINHGINHPAKLISGNLIHTSRYIQQLIQLLSLYQQHYPEPTLEIKNTINQIKLDFITTELPKVIASIKNNTKNIQQLVSYLLNFKNFGESEMKAVDLHEAIDNTLLILQYHLKSQQKSENIKIKKEYGKIPLVDCYLGELNLVFLNILSNAFKRLDNEKPEISVYTKAIDNQVLISIKDNGIGFTEEVRQSIFAPLCSNKAFEQEAGLGLSISYQIVVEKHGGELECISTSRQGTEFLIKLPVQRKNVTQLK